MDSALVRLVAFMGKLERPADEVISFYLDQGKVKGKLVRLGKEVETLIDQHMYPHSVNQYLVELIALAAALGADMKHNGSLTLQITGGKIITLMVVDINSLGHVRACAKWDQQMLEKALETSPTLSVPHAFEGGCMVFSADFEHQKDKYQAIVELSGKTLSDCIHHYFRQSDQVQSAVVLVNDLKSQGYMGGILMLQKLAPPSPISAHELEQEADDWLTDLSLLGTLGTEEFLNPNLEATTILYRLFHERTLHAQEPTPITFKCSCSYERIEGMLGQFSAEDRDHMAQNGAITITCEFCSQNYVFLQNTSSLKK